MPFLDRIIRAAKLDVSLYEEVEADVTATPQAMLVVLISSISSGIGIGLAGVKAPDSLSLLLIGAIAALVGWYVWAFLTYLIGTTIFKGPETSSSVGELLRTTGFSASPGVLKLFVFIPLLGPIIGFLASVWMLIAMIIAVRQALDFSTARAIGTCIVGWIVQFIIIGFFHTILLM